MNKQLIWIVMLSAIVLLMPADVWAQGCSVCTKVASGLGDKAAKGLNGGIIFLAFLPLSILGTLGFIWWRSNKNSI